MFSHLSNLLFGTTAASNNETSISSRIESNTQEKENAEPFGCRQDNFSEDLIADDSWIIIPSEKSLCNISEESQNSDDAADSTGASHILDANVLPKDSDSGGEVGVSSNEDLKDLPTGNIIRKANSKNKKTVSKKSPHSTATSVSSLTLAAKQMIESRKRGRNIQVMERKRDIFQRTTTPIKNKNYHLRNKPPKMSVQRSLRNIRQPRFNCH